MSRNADKRIGQLSKKKPQGGETDKQKDERMQLVFDTMTEAQLRILGVVWRAEYHISDKNEFSDNLTASAITEVYRREFKPDIEVRGLTCWLKRMVEYEILRKGKTLSGKTAYRTSRYLQDKNNKKNLLRSLVSPLLFPFGGGRPWYLMKALAEVFGDERLVGPKPANLPEYMWSGVGEDDDVD